MFKLKLILQIKHLKPLLFEMLVSIKYIILPLLRSGITLEPILSTEMLFSLLALGVLFGIDVNTHESREDLNCFSSEGLSGRS